MKRYKNRYKRKIRIQKRTLLKKKKKKKRSEEDKIKYLKTTLKYKISILPKEIQKMVRRWRWVGGRRWPDVLGVSSWLRHSAFRGGDCL